jgi:uncharacterized membrane protein (DUF4010 family)
MSLVSGIGILWTWRKRDGQHQMIPIPYNPTGLKTALSFALFYSIIIFTFTNLKENSGARALPFLAFFSGLFDMDAIALSTGRLVHKGILSEQEGKTHIFLALTANLCSKGIMTLIFGGRKIFYHLLYPWITSMLFAVFILLSTMLNF